MYEPPKEAPARPIVWQVGRAPHRVVVIPSLSADGSAVSAPTRRINEAVVGLDGLT